MTKHKAWAVPRMSVSAAIQLLVFIIVIVVIWLVLGAYVLHLHASFAGFLFLWYWATVEKADFRRLLSSAMGAILGAVLVWQMTYLPAKLGTPGLVMSLAVLAVTVFVQLINWTPLPVNNSTMLFLTVLTAPALISTVSFQDVAISVAVGTVYFAAAVYMAKAYAGARIRAKPQIA